MVSSSSDEHLCRRARHNLRGGFHWLALYLFAGTAPGLVGSWPTRCHCSAANCRNDWGWRRGGARALVRVHVCICGTRDAGAVRSASPTRDSRALPVRAKSDVHRGNPHSSRRGALLRVVIDVDLCGRVFPRDSSLRGVLRGANVAANFRIGLRNVLPAG